LRDLVRCRARLEMSEESYSSTGGDGEGMGRLTTWLQQLFLRGRSNPSSVAMRRDHFSTVAMQRTPLCAHTSTCNSLPAACLVVCPPQPSFRTRTATQQQVCLARRTSLAAASSQLGAAGTTAIRPMPHAVHGSKKLLEYRDSREDTARPSRETASTFWQVCYFDLRFLFPPPSPPDDSPALLLPKSFACNAANSSSVGSAGSAFAPPDPDSPLPFLAPL